MRTSTWVATLATLTNSGINYSHFCRNEVFLLSFTSTHSDEIVNSNPPPTPLMWVMCACSVLSVREMTQCRPTEIPEQHVHVCESRYIAADQVIKKIKGSLKKPTISQKVCVVAIARGVGSSLLQILCRLVLSQKSYFSSLFCQKNSSFPANKLVLRR